MNQQTQSTDQPRRCSFQYVNCICTNFNKNKIKQCWYSIIRTAPWTKQWTRHSLTLNSTNTFISVLNSLSTDRYYIWWQLATICWTASYERGDNLTSAPQKVQLTLFPVLSRSVTSLLFIWSSPYPEKEGFDSIFVSMLTLIVHIITIHTISITHTHLLVGGAGGNGGHIRTWGANANHVCTRTQDSTGDAQGGSPTRNTHPQENLSKQTLVQRYSQSRRTHWAVPLLHSTKSEKEEGDGDPARNCKGEIRETAVTGYSKYSTMKKKKRASSPLLSPFLVRTSSRSRFYRLKTVCWPDAAFPVTRSIPAQWRGKQDHIMEGLRTSVLVQPGRISLHYYYK